MDSSSKKWAEKMEKKEVDPLNSVIPQGSHATLSIRKWEECRVVLLKPDGIVVNNRGEVYIGEARRNCITKLDSEGRFMESFWERILS